MGNLFIPNIKFGKFCIVVAFGLIAAFNANGASISVTPATTDNLLVGQQFTVSIDGTEFNSGSGDPGTLGGGLDVIWDPNVLTIANIDDVVFSRTAGAFDIVDRGALSAGQLLNHHSVALAGAYAEAFEYSQITFTAVGVGSSEIALRTGFFDSGVENSWVNLDANNPVFFDPLYVSASVTVAPSAVPLPAAIALLPMAFGLICRRRRSSSI